jgi:hypothetical protein
MSSEGLSAPGSQQFLLCMAPQYWQGRFLDDKLEHSHAEPRHRVRSQTTHRLVPKEEELSLEKQPLCRRREGSAHVRLNSGLEGRWFKTNGFTRSRSFVDGQQRPHVGKPFFAVGLGRRL